ncbi:MAG: GNAT family N-acetyltransferase [Pseudomonadota bacterium]
MTIIRRTDEIRLTTRFEADIAHLLDEPFRRVFGTRTFFQNRHHVRFTAHVGDALVGHLAVGLRAVRLGEEILDVIGIAEVGVDRAHRGQGIARALMEAALEEGRASPASFALLFGDAKIYGSMGFAKAANPVTSTKLEAARTGETITETEHPLMVCPLTDRAWDETLPLDLAGFRF